MFRKSTVIISILFLSLIASCAQASSIPSTKAGVTQPPVITTTASSSIEPPPATLEINGTTQESGIGSYCWSGAESTANLTQCTDAIGVVTARDPLITSTPYTGIFLFPMSDPPESLYITVMAVTAADEISAGADGSHRFWRPVSGWSGELPLKTRVENKFIEDPGLYVLQLNARWKNVGEVSYGFLVQVGSGSNTLSPIPTVLSGTQVSIPTPLLLQNISPLTRLGKGVALNLKLSPSGKQLGIVTSIGVYLYDLSSQQGFWFKTFENAPTTISFSPDGNTLAVGSKANVLSILDAQTGETILRIKGEEGIHAVWSPDGTKLLTSAGCGQVNILNGSTGALLHVLEPSQCNDVTPGYVNAVWSWDGHRIYVNKGNGYVLAWDASTYQLLTGYNPDPPEYAFGFDIAPSPTQNLFAVANGTSVAIMDGETGQIAKMLASAQQDVPLGAVSWSPNGKELVAGNADGLHIWNIEIGEEVASINGYQALAGLDWMPDGETLVGLFSADGGLNGINVNTKAVDFTLQGFSSMSGSRFPVWDNNTLLTYYGNTEMRWNPQTGDLLQMIPWTSSPNWAEKYGGDSTISPDGKRVALGVAVLDAKTGAELAHLAEDSRSRDRVAWSPDGDKVVSGDSLGMADTVVWDSHTGQILLRLDHSQSYLGALAWSPDGKQIAGGSDGFVSVWDSETGRQTHLLSDVLSNERVQSVAWSPDDHWLAAGTASGRIYLWNMQSYGPFAILNGHTDQVLGLSWSPDKILLASTSMDGTVLIWQVP